MSIFNISKQTQGGGLLNDVDGTVVKSYTRQFDFTKKDGTVAAGDVPVWTIVIKAGDVEREENYGVGRGLQSVIRATKDGKTFEARPGQTMPEGFNANTPSAKLTTELANVKCPVDVDAGNNGKGDVSVIEGLTFHWNRKVETFTGNDGKPAKTEILLPTAYVGKGKATAAGGAKAAKGKAAEPAEDDDSDDSFDVEEATVELVQAILGEADDNTITKAAVLKPAFAAMKEDSDTWTDARKKEATRLLTNSKFFAADGRPWTWDGKSIAL